MHKSGIKPLNIEDWHGYSPYPGANRDARKPEWGIPVEKLLHKVHTGLCMVSAWEDHKPERPSTVKRASHFPVMMWVETQKKISGFAHNDGFKKLRVLRVVDSVEDFTGYYSPRTRRKLKVRGKLSWVYLTAQPLLKLRCASGSERLWPCLSLAPITERCEREPACLRRIDPPQTTWDQHVASANTRTINGKGLTKLIKVTTSQELWCKTCVSYTEQFHECIPIERFSKWLYYKMARLTPFKSGRYAELSTARQVELWVAREREEERMKRVAAFERELRACGEDRRKLLAFRAMRRVVWDKSFGERFRYAMGRVTSVVDRIVHEPLVRFAATELQNWDEGSYVVVVAPTVKVVDYLPVPRCKHPLKRSFTFCTGTTIEMCPDCTTFDKNRTSVLRAEYVFKSSSAEEQRWDGVLKKEGLSFERAAVHPKLLWDVERAAKQEDELSELFSLSNSEQHEQEWRASEKQARKDRRAKAVSDKKRPERYEPPVSSTDAACWFCHGKIEGKRKGTKYCTKACCNNGAELRKRIKKQQETICQ